MTWKFVCTGTPISFHFTLSHVASVTDAGGMTMAKFSLLYTDVSNLEPDTLSDNLDHILDDILELQTKMDDLHDKYKTLLAAAKKAVDELDEVI
jgi:hypothetical protein